MSTGFIYDRQFQLHDTGEGHPERAERLTALLDALKGSGLRSQLEPIAPRVAEDRWLTTVHDPEHVRRVTEACHGAPKILDASDTVVCSESLRAARMAVGGVLEGVDAVQSGTVRRAFVCARPPGHHAERNAAMGFCLFNQAAVGARYLQEQHGIERVAIIDFDVHHGNGTQHAFEEDPSVYYVSLHQWPWYPGTGGEGERGAGAGEGATLNCPMAAGTTDADWINAVEQKVLPELEAFDPGFVLVSAGFDAHELDPLSGTRLSGDGYRVMTERLVGLAERCCGGKLVSMLEGGYSSQGIGEGATAHIAELL